MSFKKLLKFAVNNYFISIFLACILFVGFISVFKLFFTKPTYVYARVKVGQGLWWASTQQLNIWFVKAIKPGEVERDLLGEPSAEIIDSRYYPWTSSTNQYIVYVTLKLKASVNKRTKEYSFNRSTIGVGSPIDLEFPTVQFSGTIVDLSQVPFADSYIEKTITLTKKSAYPWEYDAIKIGDSYFDGQDTVFQIIDKQAVDTASLTHDTFGNFTAQTSVPQKYITITAKIKVRDENGQLMFGEEQLLTPGKTLVVTTSNFSSQDYAIGSIK